MRSLLLSISCCAFFTLYQLQALFPALSSEFHADLKMAGWMNMACLLGMVLTAPFAGRWVAKTSPRLGLLSCLLGLAGLTCGLGFSVNMTQILVIRLLEGMVVPFILTICMALTATAQSERQRGQWIACYVVGTVLGSSLSRFLPGFFIAEWGWQAGFMLCASLVGCVFLLVCFFGTMLPRQPWKLPPKAQSAGFLSRALADYRLRLACLFGFVLLFSQSSVLVVLGLHLGSREIGMTSDQIGMVYLACLPSLLVVAFSARLHEVVRGWRMPVGLLFGFWLSMPLVSDAFVLIVLGGVALFSVATYLAQTCTARLVSRVQNIPVASASGIYLSFYYLGGALGAALSAYAYAAQGWQGVLILLFAAQLFAVCLFFILWTKGKGNEMAFEP
jgi:MFS family permease